MIVLALDSTTASGSVALHLAGGELEIRGGDASRGWSERLPGEALRLLTDHDLTLADVEIFAVASGPGSLTGLRVGIATIQGFAFATGRHVVAVSALEALAEHASALVQARPTETPLIGAWINAMRSEVFAQLFHPGHSDRATVERWTPVTEPRVARPEHVAAEWEGAVEHHALVVIGDVDDRSREILAARFTGRLTTYARPLLAGVVATLAIDRAARGESVVPHAVRPLYVRKPDAVLARERARDAGSPTPASS